jgi:hypothetical protein
LSNKAQWLWRNEMNFEQKYLSSRKAERKQCYKDILIMLTAAISIGTIWVASWGFCSNDKYATLKIVPESTSLNLSEQSGNSRVLTCNYIPRAAHPTGEKVKSSSPKRGA